MDPFLPKSDWYLKYWYSPKPPEPSKKSSRVKELVARCRAAVNGSASEVCPPGYGGGWSMSRASQLTRTISRWRPDIFVLALAATVALATLLPLLRGRRHHFRHLRHVRHRIAVLPARRAAIA
jgi:hypothetical protein